MYRAAFCLAFACFLRAGEVTWSTFDPSTVLAVRDVAFSSNFGYATIRLPASKTDPFRQGANLIAPAVTSRTCAVAALRAICGNRDSFSPLLELSGSRPFDRASFLDTLRRCLTTFGVAAASYAGHSFRRGAATWAAHCGASTETIRALGRWRSDCFRRYIDRPISERRATAAAALYGTMTGPLVLEDAWRDF